MHQKQQKSGSKERPRKQQLQPNYVLFILNVLPSPATLTGRHSCRCSSSSEQYWEIQKTNQNTESQNGLGWKGPQGSQSSNPPSCMQGHQPPHFIPAQAAQGPIQPGLEHLQGWTGHPQPLWVYYVLVDVLSFKYLEHIYTYSSRVTVAAGKR